MYKFIHIYIHVYRPILYDTHSCTDVIFHLGDFTGPMNYVRATIRGLNSEKGLSKKIDNLRLLLIWGTNDGALSNEMAEMSLEYANNIQLKFVEGASHWVQQDEPSIVNQYLDQFLSNVN